ncbi:Pectate lyase superfamily protein [Trema orientale]|uniref:Pectate lyase superfamily protein n=1 Tax=Trema orientale TaxID=63057 RepID=A0A2P5FJ39_TREOI|nr:Pectate lyase superfamily protein [Trema orientale]
MLIVLAIVLALLSTNVVESRKEKVSSKERFEYLATSCRSHKVSLTDFGGVGDGTTSNTKSFQAAINYLSNFSSDRGSLLFVPAGKWLTGSFNLTSHFTLFLHKDAVLLGSQDEKEWPVIEPLPSYGKNIKGGRFSSLIFGTNLTDVIITGIYYKYFLIEFLKKKKKKKGGREIMIYVHESSYPGLGLTKMGKVHKYMFLKLCLHKYSFLIFIS